MRPADVLPAVRAFTRGDFARGERFAAGPPSLQAAVDAAPCAWASELPLPGVKAGHVNLFTDPRVEWAIDALGGVGGATCVELGPLEGGHSYMLEQAGADRVTAIEANMDAYLKCLIVKEILGLERCSFLCGDAVEYLRVTEEPFDVGWCAGFLYHMTEPVQLIDLLSQRASRLYMWTQYYDADKLPPEVRNGPFANGQVTEAVHKGYRHHLHRHEYGYSTRLRGFWGGTRTHSNWLTLDDILGALEHFGWRDIQTQVDERHQNGPAVNLVATR
jgi:hypothetical protein